MITLSREVSHWQSPSLRSNSCPPTPIQHGRVRTVGVVVAAITAFHPDYPRDDRALGSFRDLPHAHVRWCGSTDAYEDDVSIIAHSGVFRNAIQFHSGARIASGNRSAYQHLRCAPGCGLGNEYEHAEGDLAMSPGERIVPVP